MNYISIEQFCADYNFTAAEARLLIDCGALDTIRFCGVQLISENTADERFQYRMENTERRSAWEEIWDPTRLGS